MYIWINSENKEIDELYGSYTRMKEFCESIPA